MTALRAHNISLSLDGYAAGPHQREDEPMGDGGVGLHAWVFTTRGGRAMIGDEGGSTGLDEDFFQAGVDGIGATIMGRNMFGPVRGPWPDGSWQGWWGPEPPYGHDVIVLTHHPRPDLELGATTFHFMAVDPHEALTRAAAYADGRDVRLGGGAATIRAFLAAGLLDHLHVAITPVLLGTGERLFDGLDQLPAGYRCRELQGSGAVVHAVIERA